MKIDCDKQLCGVAARLPLVPVPRQTGIPMAIFATAENEKLQNRKDQKPYYEPTEVPDGIKAMAKELASRVRGYTRGKWTIESEREAHAIVQRNSGNPQLQICLSELFQEKTLREKEKRNGYCY